MIYILNNDKIEYFISMAFEKKDDEIILDLTMLDEKTKTIGKNAFRGSEKIDYLYCKKIETIESEAFKDCSDLKEVIFAEEKPELKTGTDSKPKKSAPFVLNGIKLPQTNNFTIQTLAFENCENLATVILPKSSKFFIEKNAFKNCSSLRTVVAIGDDASFTQNPFEDCPEELVFVCAKDSYVERFARENGYRYVNVQRN